MTEHSAAADGENLPRVLSLHGRRLLLRSLQPEDVGRLLEFFASHTPETIHQRYGYTFTQMTPERAARLVKIDPERDAALGVFEETSAGHMRLIAIGRYCLAGDGQHAEVAFVVHEQRRRLHIASTLLDALVCIARKRGLDHLFAQVQHDNVAMLAVFRRAGAIEHDDANCVTVCLPLRDAWQK